MKNILKQKRGSEIIQTLIVIAIMGVLAVTSIMAISSNISDKANDVNTTLGTQLDNASNYDGS